MVINSKGMQKQKNTHNVAVLVSGGVDSTVALYLLKQQGYNVHAFYLKVWNEDDTTFGDCPWQEDVEYVTRVCKQLKVPCDILSMQQEYWHRVVDYTINAVKRGLTPNPDMMCNRLVKFGAFYEKIGHEFDNIATGHWAKLQRNAKGRRRLFLCRDLEKDQTYFLSQMHYNQLERAIFPLGDFTKSEIRKLAAEQRFPNAARKDSQGICFLGKINYRDFIKKHIGEQPGYIINQQTGDILGEHQGFWFYTIGQRHGLGLGGGPWFVVDKDCQNNILYVASGNNPEMVHKNKIELSHFNWIHRPRSLSEGTHALQFKIRHTPELINGDITIQQDRMIIKPVKPVYGVAAGQFGAIYKDGECLGSGVIV